MAFAKKKDEPKQEKPAVVVPTTKAGKFAELLKLSAALDKENKSANTFVRLGDKVGKPVPSIRTGLYTFDHDAVQCGGIPRGRIIEIFGPESAGKTTIALDIIAQEQKQGGIAAIVDAEHALDPTYAAHLGVDVDNLVVNQPMSGEEALANVEALVDSRLVSLIVVDSVAALTPRAELEGEMGDSNVGLQARLMSQAMRKLTGKAEAFGITIIFINQIREKIGVMFGSPETTTGGRALKFYSSVRIDVRRREVLGEKERPVGHRLELKIVKNKCGAPFRSTMIDLYYPNGTETPGLDRIGDLIRYCDDHSLFEYSGSWYIMDIGTLDEHKKPVGKERLANGYLNLRNRLKEDPKALAAVEKAATLFRQTEIKSQAPTQ